MLADEKLSSQIVSWRRASRSDQAEKSSLPHNGKSRHTRQTRHTASGFKAAPPTPQQALAFARAARTFSGKTRHHPERRMDSRSEVRNSKAAKRKKRAPAAEIAVIGEV